MRSGWSVNCCKRGFKEDWKWGEIFGFDFDF